MKRKRIDDSNKKTLPEKKKRKINENEQVDEEEDIFKEINFEFSEKFHTPQRKEAFLLMSAQKNQQLPFNIEETRYSDDSKLPFSSVSVQTNLNLGEKKKKEEVVDTKQLKNYIYPKFMKVDQNKDSEGEMDVPTFQKCRICKQGINPYYEVYSPCKCPHSYDNYFHYQCFNDRFRKNMNPFKKSSYLFIFFFHAILASILFSLSDYEKSYGILHDLPSFSCTKCHRKYDLFKNELRFRTYPIKSLIFNVIFVFFTTYFVFFGGIYVILATVFKWDHFSILFFILIHSIYLILDKINFISPKSDSRNCPFRVFYFIYRVLWSVRVLHTFYIFYYRDSLINPVVVPIVDSVLNLKIISGFVYLYNYLLAKINYWYFGYVFSTLFCMLLTCQCLFLNVAGFVLICLKIFGLILIIIVSLILLSLKGLAFFFIGYTFKLILLFYLVFKINGMVDIPIGYWGKDLVGKWNNFIAICFDLKN